MKFTYLTILFGFIALASSCDGTDANINDTLDSDTTSVDTVTMAIDTTSVLPDSLVEAGYVDETEEVANIIEKKYGKQWDFCDCAVKNDSIDKASLELDGKSDEEVDVFFARWDEIENHCKEILTVPNTTPEERDRHARKILKCLKNAGK